MLGSWDENMKVFQNKHKLRQLEGTKIYIDKQTLTKTARKVQTLIRQKAQELKKEDDTVKIQYKKLIINNRIWKWDAQGEKLIEIQVQSEDTLPKN